MVRLLTSSVTRFVYRGICLQHLCLVRCCSGEIRAGSALLAPHLLIGTDVHRRGRCHICRRCCLIHAASPRRRRRRRRAFATAEPCDGSLADAAAPVSLTRRAPAAAATAASATAARCAAHSHAHMHAHTAQYNATQHAHTAQHSNAQHALTHTAHAQPQPQRQRARRRWRASWSSAS
jgi:hypothetical protein